MSVHLRCKKFGLYLFSLLLVASIVLVNVRQVIAAVNNPAPQAQISFTFDDGLTSNLTNAAPVLAKYGYTGTGYITTNCVGKTRVPNTCPADNNIPYMTWAQIKTLQNSFDWEIGSHGVSHVAMSEVNATKIDRELSNSKSILQSQGFNPTAFATPYGDYNGQVLTRAAKYYTSHRGFADIGYNNWPHNNYLLRVQQVQYGVSVETVKGYIDQAKASKTWLILVFHEVRANPSTILDDYQYATADLEAIAAYAKHVNLKGTNITNGLVTGTAADNKLSNPINGALRGNGWTTDAPASVKVDTANNGSAPESAQSLKITTSSTKNIHLFAPKISVQPGSQHVIKGYANRVPGTNGEVGFYIDEYDSNGNWISGQYKQTIHQWHVKDVSFSYVPSSSNVTQARLQIIVSKAQAEAVYLDNLLWFNVLNLPQPEPGPQPNLLKNGTFESGWTGWRTDNNSVMTLDANGNGSGANPVHSIKLAAGMTNAHLFSDKVTVNSGVSYAIKGYVDVRNLTGGEVGFYIDEYDSNGNWISGKYFPGVRTVGVKNINFSYTPSSGSVTHASLQVIAEGGSGILAYVDDFSLRN